LRASLCSPLERTRCGKASEALAGYADEDESSKRERGYAKPSEGHGEA
jgi:hypothetical protein